MNSPNFFIIGAPKCGTTSLATWLRAHPEVFVSEPKEPMYFNVDFGYRFVTDRDTYDSLFTKASIAHKAIGEASTFYLCSTVAVPRIVDSFPDAKFIVMLRDPREMVASLHAQACRGYETIRSFEAAWKLQDQRRAGFNLPAFATHPEIFQYGTRCLVGQQLMRLFQTVPKHRVLVLYLEDIITTPEFQLSRVCDFLGIAPNAEMPFPRDNSRRNPRSFFLKRALNAAGWLSGQLGVKPRSGILAPLHRLNTSRHGGERISDEFASELAAYFAEDISITQTLVGRVPSNWLAPVDPDNARQRTRP